VSRPTSATCASSALVRALTAGDQPATGVAQAQGKHLRVSELGSHLGEKLPQGRKVYIVVRLGLGDVRRALQGQHLPGVPGAEPGHTSSVPGTILLVTTRTRT